MSTRSIPGPPSGPPPGPPSGPPLGEIPAPLLGDSRPCSFAFDGETVEGMTGVPLAAALMAAGKVQIARSPKFHRPRGPACFRGACDGCLLRVDGEPNVLSCLVPLKGGMVVESQNTLGTRNLDFLRMTDWFFPEGMNHHELFAGVPGISSIMQVFARRVAGLGKLPKESAPSTRAIRRTVDALVVGGGASGLAIAFELVKQGRTVEIIDDAIFPGGSLRSLPDADAGALSAILARLTRAEKGDGLAVRSHTTVGGIFGDDVLAVGPSGAEILNARDLILAPGAHDGVLAFEGNDVPGVMSARALGLLLRLGVKPGRRLCIVKSEGAGPFADAAYALANAMKMDAEIVVGTPVRVAGASRVKAITVASARSKEKEFRADIVAVDSPTAPAYELCEQAGATLVHEARGYVVHTEKGRIREGVWALGEVCGTPFDVARMVEDARKVARAIAGRSARDQSSSKAPKSETPPSSATASKTPSNKK